MNIGERLLEELRSKRTSFLFTGTAAWYGSDATEHDETDYDYVVLFDDMPRDMQGVVMRESGKSLGERYPGSLANIKYERYDFIILGSRRQMKAWKYADARMRDVLSVPEMKSRLIRKPLRVAMFEMFKAYSEEYR